MKFADVAYIVGWYGAAALLVAFTTVSVGWLAATSSVYLLLNLTGAICLTCSSLARRAYPPAALNAVWALVAVSSLLRSIFG